MKRLVSLFAATCLILGGLNAVSTPAFAETSSPKAAASYIWFYTSAYYGGSIYAYHDLSSAHFDVDIKSVVNSSDNTCWIGRNYVWNTYTFWPGGQWPTIGNPFMTYPLRWAYRC